MSASIYRGQFDRKRRQRLEAEKKAGEYRSKESRKRAEAAKARQAASSTKSESTRRSKLREAERKEKEAEAAGREAGRWQDRAAGYAREEVNIQKKLIGAEQSEAQAAERQRVREQQQAAAERRSFATRVARTENAITEALWRLPAPKPERLRVLILGASADGGLRVGREQKRIRQAVESALHRDQIELDVRPAATTSDLLDGMTRFRPHVVHFSGHSNETLIEFERDIDEAHSEGAVVSATAFAHAVRATDTPPLLVLLNSCNSAAQIDKLVEDVAPFAIGMADSIEDVDAISYAAQFYAAVANGQSIASEEECNREAMARAVGLKSSWQPGPDGGPPDGYDGLMPVEIEVLNSGPYPIRGAVLVLPTDDEDHPMEVVYGTILPGERLQDTYKVRRTEVVFGELTGGATLVFTDTYDNHWSSSTSWRGLERREQPARIC